jgi:hypothetical protein
VCFDGFRDTFTSISSNTEETKVRKTYTVQLKPQPVPATGFSGASISCPEPLLIQADSCSVSPAGDLVFEEHVYFKQELTKDLIKAIAAGSWSEVSVESTSPHNALTQ